MKIPQEIAEKVINDTMKILWETFVTLEGEYAEFKRDYIIVKYGEKAVFPIYWLWKDTSKIILKSKDNMVYIDGEQYTEDEFETEKEVRRKIMTEAIINNISEKEVIVPR